MIESFYIQFQHATEGKHDDTHEEREVRIVVERTLTEGTSSMTAFSFIPHHYFDPPLTQWNNTNRWFRIRT